MAVERPFGHRSLTFIAPSGVGPFLVTRLSGSEGLGQPFEFTAELLSLDHQVDFATIVAQPVAVQLAADGNGPGRVIHGFVSRFVQTEQRGRHMQYLATIVPFVWFLNRTADCRIFEPNPVPKIVRQVLSERGFDDFEDKRLIGSYPVRDHCVQYRETDFNFISRLMEEEGIFYFFDHRQDGDGVFRHVMVLCDDHAARRPGPGCAVLRSSANLDDDANVVTGWTVMNHVHAARAALIDYDVETRAVLLSRNGVQLDHAAPFGTIVDHPGGFTSSGDGDRLVGIRAQEYATRATVYRGTTTAHGLAAGATFKLVDHPRADQNDEYFVVSSSAEAHGDGGDSGAPPLVGSAAYTCSFEAIRLTSPFRPARTTAKPLIQGPQTALVVGDEHDEVLTDELGRVRVKFHWDTRAEQREKASCFVRVAQIWAGNRWGAMFMPRVGHEVVVEFLEGDPDRPIITGRVYNGMAKPPYDPRKHATVSTIKSMSSGAGGGFNELRFEDKKGSEQVFIHAQRRLDLRVCGSSFETVGGDREELVGSGDKGDLNRTVGNDSNTHEKGGRFELVDEKLNTNVKLDVVEVFETSHTIAVTGRQTLNASETAIEAEQTLSLKGDKVVMQGAEALSLRAGNIKIEGTQSISFKVGSNFIVLSPSGIFINGATVFINTGGSPQAADAPLIIEDPALETPFDALPASGALPGDGGGSGAPTGGRSRVSRTVALRRAPEPPPAPPLAPRAILPGTADRHFVDIAWVEKETFCGGPATLKGTTLGYGDGEPETVEIRNVIDGGTVAVGSVGISGNAFNQSVEVRDWLPRDVGEGFEEARDEQAIAAGQRTPTPLRMKFIPNLDHTDCGISSRTGVGSHFGMRTKNYVCKVGGTISYVRGFMGRLIQLGKHVPDGTGGSSGLNFGAANPKVMSGTDWRLAKLDPHSRKLVFWNGGAWVPVPDSWRDSPGGTKLFGIGIWSDGASSKAEFGLSWPDPILEWTPAEQARADATFATWVGNTEKAWSNKFDLRRDGCSSTDQRCCRYSVTVDIGFSAVTADEKGRHTIVVGINDARSNSNAWSLGDTRPGLAPHEFGHHLGCPDEYPGAGSVDASVNTDGAQAGVDRSCLMGSVPKAGIPAVKARCFDVVKQHLAALIHAQKGVTFTFTAVPHL
jgi:type VI secretion system secreted protein VgrG